MINISPSSKRESTDERRAAIAMATRQLIIEKGFEGLRTRDIADRVGINIATLHYHVPSRDALIELVAHTIKQQFMLQSQSRPRHGKSPLELLRMEMEDFREIIRDEPDLAVIFSEMMDKARRDTKVRDVMTPLHVHWAGMIHSLLAAGVEDGTFRADLDAQAAALMITGALGDYWRRTPEDIPTFNRLALEIERSIINPAFLNKETPQ